MVTQVRLADRLVQEAVKIGWHKTKKEAVAAALREYIRGRKQLGILELTGQIEYGSKYDYKKLRGKRSVQATW